jgi:hypothetical protein
MRRIRARASDRRPPGDDATRRIASKSSHVAANTYGADRAARKTSDAARRDVRM